MIPGTEDKIYFNLGQVRPLTLKLVIHTYAYSHGDGVMLAAPFQHLSEIKKHELYFG